MGPESKSKYTKLVEEKIASGEIHLKNLEEARNTSESKMTSRYDTQREGFAMEANLQRTILENLREFRSLLSQWGPCTKITEGAEFTVELWDAEDVFEGAIYSPIRANLPDVQIVTPQSPVGTAIKGMVAGNTFVYKINGKLMAGIIKEIR